LFVVRPYDPGMADALSPSTTLITQLSGELARHMPFSRMAGEHVRAFVAAASQAYFAPGDTVLEPASGPVKQLLCVRQGSIVGTTPGGAAAHPIEYGPGDLFPVGALLAGRAVQATYRAEEDTFCLRVPAEQVQAIAAQSPPLADWLQHRVTQMLELSRQAAQSHWSAQALAEQSMETPLARLPQRTPLACTPDTPLGQALQHMHDARVGSILALDADGTLRGIFTRHDVLGRVTLPQRALSTPLREVMSQPVQSLTAEHTLQDAALLMSRHGLRHVPVVAAGRVVNIVSERDLFALQRLSLKSLGVAIREAADLPTLRVLAARIHDLARALLGQGVRSRQITEIVSHLNDRLTERVVHLVAAQQGVDLGQACWLAFGSEGRGEQTVATDQDNGLVFTSAAPEADRPRWLAFGRAVNAALADCGYPLCQGGVMAGEPACCLSQQEWRQRFGDWIEHGAPEDLLNASIYFDLRPLAGATQLAEPLLDMVRSVPARVPRFLKQMADNALRRPVPLNWRGRIDTHERGGREWADLKLQGTAIFVDAARLFALVHGVAEQGTRQRLQAVAPLMNAPPRESEAWVVAFEFLQMLRLQAQLAPGADAEHPNDVEVRALNDIDRRMLKEALRAARSLQQRIALDFGG
jgi:CBS domain-containing protein